MAEQSNNSQPVKRDLTRLPLTEEDLDALAVITEADILRAQQEARRLLPRKYRNLLQAEAIDDGLPAA